MGKFEIKAELLSDEFEIELTNEEIKTLGLSDSDIQQVIDQKADELVRGQVYYSINKVD